MLKGAGAFGVIGAASLNSALCEQKHSVDAGDAPKEPSTDELLAELESREVTISSDQMTVGIDTHRGTLTGIVRRADSLHLNYLGNLRNTPARLSKESTWTGDVALTTWLLERDWKSDDTAPNVPFHMSGKWSPESTARSNDVRKIQFDGNSMHVEYEGASTIDGGLKSIDLHNAYTFDKAGALIWEIKIKNTTAALLEIGELGIPICVNDDYSEFSSLDAARVLPTSHLDAYSVRTNIQQSLIHEQKVFAHHFVAGHSSYSLIERPLGDPPFLLFHPIEDTPLECIYPEIPSRRSFSVPEVLAIHSRATKDLRGWSHNQWVNGHTSILLKSGEEKSYKFRFTFIPSYDAIRSELARAGNLGIRIVPAMVVQENQPVRVELDATSPLDDIEIRSDNVAIKQVDAGGKTQLTLQFKGRGTKSIRLLYGGGRWTNLHFYCTEDFETLLKSRAGFIAAREYYLNEEDPFHRYHMFLPFDYRRGNIILESDEAWEVGGSDEPGFSTPLFLAEMNVYYPNREQIDALENYVSDCLFKYIQNPENYSVRASLYWVDRKPSSPWSEWSEDRSEPTWRTYNYVHPANIYHALYRIGKRYGLTTHRDPQAYLRMSYQTCMKWFETGPWKTVGLMEGSNVLNILADIYEEGWTSEYAELLKAVKACDQVFVAQSYPYSSELLIDQTAHEQVYFFTRYFGNLEKNAKTVQVLKALRGGNQPIWFHYGNDKRGDICCWYSASLNGLALIRSFEESADQDALARGYGGIASVMSNVTADGMGFNYFDCAAGVLDHQPPTTWEGGCGLWGFLQATKAIVVQDAAFGLVGYGCNVEESHSSMAITPHDGLRKRIFISEQKLTIDLDAGEIDRCVVDRSTSMIVLSVSDSTSLVRRVGVRVTGLPAGSYSVGSDHKVVTADGKLRCECPFREKIEITIRKNL